MSKRRSAFSMSKTAETVAPAEIVPAQNPTKPNSKKNKKKRKREATIEQRQREEAEQTGPEPEQTEESFLDLRENAEQLAEGIFKKMKKTEQMEEEDSGIADEAGPSGKSPVPSVPPKLPVATWQSDSLLDATKQFCWMIHPMRPEQFMEEFWEKKATLIRRDDQKYYADFFSTKAMAEILERNPLQFGVNVDVTSWDAKQGRQTHNPPGRAYPAKLWDYYNNGCSVRMLNPQTYSNSIWKMCAGLQEFFGCFTGANTYLTPASTQGFAPHYDDVEVFMLQVEGRKRWKVYPPFENDELPRTSSRNYKPSEVKQEMAIYEILNPGDVLYVPRGWIHQGECLAGEHSLHVTVSTYQKNAWADLLEHLVPQALSAAIRESADFRRGLPTDYKLYMGLANSDRAEMAQEREMFTQNVVALMQNMISFADVDKAVDKIATNDLHCSLPPALNRDEISRTIKGERVVVEDGSVKKGLYQIDENAQVRIIRLQSVRVVMEEENTIMLYHNYDNPRIYKKEELKGFEITSECAAIVDMLTAAYPKYIKVTDLVEDGQELESVLESVFSLLESGVLMTKEPTKLE